MINFSIKPSEFDRNQFDFQSFWEKYNIEILSHYLNTFPDRECLDLEKKGFYQNSLKNSEVNSFIKVIKKSKQVDFSNLPDFNFNYTDFENIGIAKSYKKDSCFYELNIYFFEILNSIFERIKLNVASQLGSPWKVLMVRIWTTDSKAKPQHMYGWHTDGMPHEIFKIMLYFNPLNDKNGTLEINYNNSKKKFISSAPGSWVLFKNSEVFHRGVPPKVKSKKFRVACEVTISRAFNYILTPRYAGNTAHWPKAPWNQAQIFNDSIKKKSLRKITNNNKLIRSVNSIKDSLYRKLNRKDRLFVKILTKINNF